MRYVLALLLAAGQLVGCESSPIPTSEPAVTHTSTQIAFVSNRDGDSNIYYDIYVMDADGGNVQRLTTEGRWGDSSPTWSPDGIQISFVSNPNIYVMDADGRNVRKLTDGPGWNGYPAWSPVLHPRT